jgi:predicted ribosomally synthesized peptide with SipW-like signal peptide
MYDISLKGTECQELVKGGRAMKKVVISLLVIGVVAAVALIGAVALFTDTETNPTNSFTTGTVILSIDPATAMFTVTAMAPGNVTYDGLQVTNGGSLELRYAMTTTDDDTSILDEQLDLTIDVVTEDGDDNVWYTLDDVVGEANVYGADGVLATAVIGDPAQGADTGDRTLAASGSERLRFTVTLPQSTGNAYQGLTCTVAFVFDAEQTANNP